MSSAYDKEQDARIAENAEAIRRLAEYMQQIRDFHMPWAYSKWQTKLRKRMMPILKMAAAITVGMSAYKGIGVYLEKKRLRAMADRYAEVAKQLYYSENNPEVALPFLEKAISIDGGCPEYLFTRAYMQGMSATRTLSNLKRPYTKAELDLAHRSYAEAKYLEGLAPKRPEPYILQGQILAVLKDPQRGKDAIEKAIALDPKNDFAYIRLAMIQLDCEKDVAGAERSLAQAEALNPKSKWVWLWKGILCSEFKGDAETARKCCDKALEIDPKFDLAHYNRGWTFATGKDKNYALAREEMMKALAINPDYKEACYAIGMFYGYEDNYPVARVWMDKAIALDRKFLSAHKWRGIICGEMGQCEEAIKSFDAAIELDPMNADLYVRRAKMFVASDKTDDALRDLRFALELDSKAKRTHVYLGDVYVKAGDVGKGLEYYEGAIRLDPSYDDALARKAAALVKLGRGEEALAAIDRAIKVTKYKPQRFWMQKGEILESLGKTAEALQCYVRVCELDERNVPAWKRQAALYKKTGNVANRKRALKKILELAPTDSEARRELEGI